MLGDKRWYNVLMQVSVKYKSKNWKSCLGSQIPIHEAQFIASNSFFLKGWFPN